MKIFNAIILILLLLITSCSEDKQDFGKAENPKTVKLGAAEEGFTLHKNDMRIRDPFILADNNTNMYYLYLNGGNGVRTYISKDLENWKDGGYVFTPPADFGGISDFWAPDVYAFNDKYYMFLTLSNNGNNRGTSILVANNPMGPFSPIVNKAATPQGQLCLDGSFFVDSEDKPWILYSHEWLQVIDGKILAQRLSDDLSTVTGDPVELFTATSAPWVGSLTAYGVTGYVTDAPFVYKTDEGKLIMLWSSFDKNGKYAIGQAYSQSGNILGPWIQDTYPLNNDDGGHAMMFKDLHNKLKITYHAPNSQTETLVVRDIFINNGKASLSNEMRIIEEFDGALVNNSVGDFYFNNYDQASSWTASIDRTSRLSGQNSLHLGIANSGTEFWTLQMRASNVKVKQGNGYNIKLKALADKNVTFEFRSEGAINYIQQLSLTANQTGDFNFNLPASFSNGECTFFFAFGNTGSNYKLWLDAIEITPIEADYTSEIIVSEQFNNPSVNNSTGSLFLNNYSPGNSSWAYSIDNSNRLGAGNSLHLNIGNTGPEFWTLQLRTGDIPIHYDRKYNVSFKVISDKDVTIDFRSEGPLNHIEKVRLTANKVCNFNFELSQPNSTNTGVMFFSFGNTGSNYSVWLDEIKVESRKY